jgi:alkaline phosphatase D
MIQNIYLLLITSILTGCQQSTNASILSKKKKDFIINFGSCYISEVSKAADKLKKNSKSMENFTSVNEKMQNNVWETLININPDIFLHLGDVIYSDVSFRCIKNNDECPPCMNNKKLPFMFYTGKDKIFWNKQQYDCNTETQWKDLLENKFYQKFKRQMGKNIRFLWDDHDAGPNNWGAWDAKKGLFKTQRKQFLQNLEIPQSQIKDDGAIYDCFIKRFNNMKIKIYILDMRYHNTVKISQYSLKKYKKETYACKWQKKEILGEKQWEWFEKEMKNSIKENIDINLIATNGYIFKIQTQPSFFNTYTISYWSKPFLKFREIIKKYKPKNLILLGGDAHHSNISKIEFKNKEIDYPDPIYQFVSSGMTHSSDKDNTTIHPNTKLTKKIYNIENIVDVNQTLQLGQVKISDKYIKLGIIKLMDEGVEKIKHPAYKILNEIEIPIIK